MPWDCPETKRSLVMAQVCGFCLVTHLLVTGLRSKRAGWQRIILNGWSGKDRFYPGIRQEVSQGRAKIRSIRSRNPLPVLTAKNPIHTRGDRGETLPWGKPRMDHLYDNHIPKTCTNGYFIGSIRREIDQDGCSLALRRLRPDGAALHLNQRFDNRQPQPALAAIRGA